MVSLILANPSFLLDGAEARFSRDSGVLFFLKIVHLFFIDEEGEIIIFQSLYSIYPHKTPILVLLCRHSFL